MTRQKPAPITADHALDTAIAWERKTAQARSEHRDAEYVCICEAQMGSWFYYATLAETDPTHPDLPLVFPPTIT